VIFSTQAVPNVFKMQNFDFSINIRIHIFSYLNFYYGNDMMN